MVGADVVADDMHLLTVTDAGYGKRTDVDEFTRQGRGGQGIRAHRLHDDRGRVVTGFLAADEDDVLQINDAGVLIRTGVGSISVQGRSATGVRVMNLDDDAKVAAVARVLSSEDGSDEDGEDSAPPSDGDGVDDAATTPSAAADDTADDGAPDTEGD